MWEFISQDVTLNSDTLIMLEFIVACFAWSAALSISVLPLQSPAAVKGIITFLFVIYHDAKILFGKTLEILLPAVVSGYQRMSWSGGWSQGLWSSFLRAAQYWQTVPSIPTQLIILNVLEVFAMLNIVQFWKHLTSFPNVNGFLKHRFSDAGADCWEWCGGEKFDDSEILPGHVHQGTLSIINNLYSKSLVSKTNRISLLIILIDDWLVIPRATRRPSGWTSLRSSWGCTARTWGWCCGTPRAKRSLTPSPAPTTAAPRPVWSPSPPRTETHCWPWESGGRRWRTSAGTSPWSSSRTR